MVIVINRQAPAATIGIPTNGTHIVLAPQKGVVLLQRKSVMPLQAFCMK